MASACCMFSTFTGIEAANFMAKVGRRFDFSRPLAGTHQQLGGSCMGQHAWGKLQCEPGRRSKKTQTKSPLVDVQTRSSTLSRKNVALAKGRPHRQAIDLRAQRRASCQRPSASSPCFTRPLCSLCQLSRVKASPAVQDTARHPALVSRLAGSSYSWKLPGALPPSHSGFKWLRTYWRNSVSNAKSSERRS